MGHVVGPGEHHRLVGEENLSAIRCHKKLIAPVVGDIYYAELDHLQNYRLPGWRRRGRARAVGLDIVVALSHEVGA